MRRRTLLSLAAGSSLSGFAGCQAIPPAISGTEVPETEKTASRVIDRECSNTEDDSASITFVESGERVHISGTFGVQDISWAIDVRTRRNNSDKQKVHIQIDQFAASSANEVAADCSGNIDYEASVFLSKTPSEVVVQHINEEVGDHEGRAWLKTVATSTP